VERTHTGTGRSGEDGAVCPELTTSPMTHITGGELGKKKRI